MKNNKLIISLSTGILIILIIGLFSLYSMNRFYEDSVINKGIDNYVNNLNNLIMDFLLLINTENLEDYNKLELKIDFESSENKILYERIYSTIQTFNLDESFNENIKEFKNISNFLIDIHKKSLLKNQEFIEKAELEKSSRYEFISLTDGLDSMELSIAIWKMRYYSKEALFQYKDEKHINEWLESISEIREIILGLSLSPEKENLLLEGIDSYRIIAFDMSNIVKRLVEIKNDEFLKIRELDEVFNKFEENEIEISKKIKSQNQSLAENTFWIILFITIIGICVSLVMQWSFLFPKSKMFNKEGRK